jgi:hypothetical protein
MSLDEDPLSDYDPGDPSLALAGDTPEPPDVPWADLGDEPFDDGWEPPADTGDGPVERDYREDTSYPIEEYGTYADHYPDHARELTNARADHTHAGQTTAERVLDTLRSCIAACQGRPGADLVDLVTYVMASKAALAYLDDKHREAYQRLVEILVSEYAEEPTRTVDLTEVYGIDAAARKVQAELAVITTRLGRDDLPKTPSAAWRSLVNYVQRMTARQRALALVAKIDAGETDEACMAAFRGLEPPSASKALVNAEFSRSAKEWEEADLAAAAEAPGFRISSGYPTVDYAFTLKDARGRDAEPRGAFGPGELHIFAAPTGNGKSAAARKLITAAAEDLVVGWGREHDKVLIAITEETPKIVYTVAGLAKGQPFHHLAKNVVIASVGASRRRFVHALWDCVVDAYHRSQETGIPISNAGLPSFVVLDYVGGIVEDGESADTTALEKTANLLMRGVAAWDVQMMEEFSGESFAAYAGMSWPTGMEAFRPAVLGFAQFKKLADPLFYDPKARGASTEDFVVPNADGEPGWEVRPGDFRVPTQGEVRGSGVLINHATSLIIAHRSRPVNNPKIVDPETGRVRLVDDRARWLFVKTRNSADFPFVEMRFDSAPSGLRGQFYDKRAEIAIAKGLLEPTECYRQEGDPILPVRPRKTPFDGIAY